MAILPFSLINGLPADTVTIQDRGFSYGHGLFETVTVHQGSAVHWSEHMERLQAGAARLAIPCDQQLLDQLTADLTKLLNSVDHPNDKMILKLTLTRGSGGRGYAVTENMTVTRVLTLSPFPEYPDRPSENGIKIHLCETRLGHNPALAGIKHLNRLEQVLARSEWQDSDIREGIVCDHTGNIIEGTMSNVFWVKNGKLYTPDLTQCGVAGVVRQRILQLATAEGIIYQEVCANITELKQCDELFFSNSVIGIWPAVKCLQSPLKTNWSIGPITQKLQQALAAEGI